MPVTLSHDLVTGFISFLLTLMILSYLIGDNPAFRVAVYILSGFRPGTLLRWPGGRCSIRKFSYPCLPAALSSGLLALVPLILGVLLLMKLSPRTAWLGNVQRGFPGGSRRGSGCGWGGNGDAHPTDTGIFQCI
jgi:hypothetical protein